MKSTMRHSTRTAKRRVATRTNPIKRGTVKRAGSARSRSARIRGPLPHTGHKVERAGIYKGGDRCHRTIRVRKGSSFPPCHQCYKATTWKLVKGR